MKYLGLLAAAALVGVPALAQTPPSSGQPQAAPAAPKPQGRNRSGVYIQGGFEGLAIDEDPYFYNPSFGAIQARLGYSINKYIAIEGQASFGTYAQEFDDDGEVYDADFLDLKSSYGVFVVPRIPIGNNFGIYGRLGYVQVEYDYDTGITTSGNGPAAGLGIDLDFGPASIALDFTFSGLKEKDSPDVFGNGEYDGAGVSFAVLGGFHF